MLPSEMRDSPFSKLNVIISAVPLIVHEKQIQLLTQDSPHSIEFSVGNRSCNEYLYCTLLIV